MLRIFVGLSLGVLVVILFGGLIETLLGVVGLLILTAIIAGIVYVMRNTK